MTRPNLPASMRQRQNIFGMHGNNLPDQAVKIAEHDGIEL
jgi:hypothetical protein